jgi:hypothetical protein
MTGNRDSVECGTSGTGSAPMLSDLIPRASGYNYGGRRTERNAGPWPGWLRWYRAQGWWARDVEAWRLRQAGLSYTEIAARLDCSASTAYRGCVRQVLRERGEWPPKVHPTVQLDFGGSRRARQRRRWRPVATHGTRRG